MLPDQLQKKAWNVTCVLALVSMQKLKQYCLYWFQVPSDIAENVEWQSHELPQLLKSCHQMITAYHWWLSGFVTFKDQKEEEEEEEEEEAVA